MDLLGTSGQAPSIQPTVFVDPTARLTPNARVGPDAYVGAGAVLLQGTVVGAGTCIDDDAILSPKTKTGKNCWIGNAAELRDATVGDNVIVDEQDQTVGEAGHGRPPCRARRVAAGKESTGQINASTSRNWNRSDGQRRSPGRPPK